MEYCSGGDLLSFLENNSLKLAEDKVLDIMIQVYEGVTFLH
jgi:serine/threonine protein kinase